MTSFVNMEVVSASKPLKAGFYPHLPRSKELHESLAWCVTDYYTKASVGVDFEARGLLVTGHSRAGKTREIKRIVSKLNDGSTIMPDGRPARVVSCLLSGKVTLKELGSKTLETFGYPIEGRRTQNYIWEMVVEQARRQGVIGIHFDECQHVFTEKDGRSNRIFLDSFKTLLKDSRWPLILILSGIPSLATQIHKEEQLAALLRPVHFDNISLPKDLKMLNELVYSFAETAGLCFDPLSNADFFDRLSHACAGRWGLGMELIIEAFTIGKLANATTCSIEHFAKAFAQIYGLPFGYSPFTIPDFRECFDPAELIKILEKVG